MFTVPVVINVSYKDSSAQQRPFILSQVIKINITAHHVLTLETPSMDAT